MSCSVCRLPFTPNEEQSVNPHPPPAGILTPTQLNYHMNAVAWGSKVVGLVVDFHYLDNKLFGAKPPTPIALVIYWETEDGTAMFFHTTCAGFLRKALKAEDWTLDSVTRLCELEFVLGLPQPGQEAGRFHRIDYEHVACEREEVNLRRFWLAEQPLPGDGSNWDWEGIASSELKWTLNRPDIFPKFFIAVSEQRRTSVGTPGETIDILTTLPVDILYHLLPFLDIPEYLVLTSTCRTLRLHALTAFQPHARKLVLSLGWAVPLESEYEAAKKSGLQLAHDKDVVHDADWLLYLSHVHRTTSMRVRRWIWHICLNMQKIFEARRPKTLFKVKTGADGGLKSIRNKAGKNLDSAVKQMYPISCQFRVIAERMRKKA
ncbi:hypothetical protein EW146_g7133 [Bondarzewia mesenterica]|uniref:F-box domain-containing protein n=1 Tax=Bondarzewia mesenterica TaxID=1095465 RepID=A0A4V6S1D4_9AGAM|nr:hypothetical protein EW146_g7133 [Bondarzewia mesenterica]